MNAQVNCQQSFGVLSPKGVVGTGMKCALCRGRIALTKQLCQDCHIWKELMQRYGKDAVIVSAPEVPLICFEQCPTLSSSIDHLSAPMGEHSRDKVHLVASPISLKHPPILLADSRPF